jgi:hypothetical protein
MGDPYRNFNHMSRNLKFPRCHWHFERNHFGIPETTQEVRMKETVFNFLPCG